jgi:hypothetical protein
MGKPKTPNCKTWLRENGYPDVADRIEALERKWGEDFDKTRRNWWGVLAGTRAGKPYKTKCG